ncbi:MAG TPA: hypothetical protein PLQ31_09485, partial [Thermoanaerobaculia bacterium]|nr:hypothetical protein [Thermoanaerobaculia bacterium]
LSYRPDDDDADLDQAYVQVNGTTVWTWDLIQENDTYPDWVEQIVDLSAWAGQNVTLSSSVPTRPVTRPATSVSTSSRWSRARARPCIR